MRRYGIYLLIALITLSSGLLAHALWRRSSSPLSLSEPFTLSLCELERHPAKYDGKLVRVKAVLYSDLGPYIYDWSCGSQNIYTYPLIDLRGFDGLNSELREWSGNIGAIDSKGQGLEADVMVTGLFDKSHSDPSDDSFSHHFRIIPTRIEQLSALHRRE